MTDPNEQPQSEQSQETPQRADLAAELRELSQQLELAFRGVVESEQAKTMQRDVVAGLREIGNQMWTGLNTLRDDPRFQNLTERGQQVVNQAQETQAAKDFQETLARGAAFLNEQIASFNARQQARSASDTPVRSDMQNLTIEHEHDDDAATGETTRLDQ